MQTGSIFATPAPLPMRSPTTRLPAVLLTVGITALLAAPAARAQVEGVLEIGGDLERFLERQSVAGRLPGAILTHRPLAAHQARALLDTLAARDSSGAAGLSRTDRTLLGRFRGVRPGPGVARARRLWGTLYADGQHAVSARGDGYTLVAEPLLYLTAGTARRTERAGLEPTAFVWQNTRGVRAGGHLGRHLFFEARIEENQRRDARPSFDPRANTAPRLGNVQAYGDDGLDYYRAMGLVGLRTRFVEVRAGRDRNAWGPGRTSLVLSDYAAPYDHLQLRTRVGRLEYANLFAAFTNVTSPTRPNEPFPRRFGAFHRLALQLGPVELDAFEAIVFTDTSESRRRRGFDPAYLNPVVLLRSVEQDRNSPDNALLGGGFRWRAVHGVEVYGQVLLDEFTAGLVGKKSWANKWGLLGGIRTADVGLRGLTLGVEAARLRPYLYSHITAASAALHFESGLGHPAGPNAEDVAVFADYQPTDRLNVGFNVAVTRRGRNTAAANYGADPRLSYQTRVSDTDVRILQGVRQTDVLAEAHAGFELLPGLYAAAALRAESRRDAETGPDRYVAPSMLLRWGLPFQSARY